MVSHLYQYYTLQSDEAFSQKAAIETVTEILLQTHCLTQTGHQSFVNTSDFPWLVLSAHFTPDGNFASTEKPFSYVNLISIVCSKNVDQSVYTRVLLKIAKQLNWRLVLEQDEDGNEDV